MTHVIFSSRVRDLISSKLESPSDFYNNLIKRFFNDSPGLVSIKLKSGRVFYAYRFMDFFKLYEIFIEDDYRPGVEGVSNIVDIGGNKGYFSLRMSELFPKASYFCYEPEPTNFGNLKRLLDENNLNYIAYQEGVGSEIGQLELFIDPKNDGGHSLFRTSESLNHITVDIVTLDTVLDRIPSGEKVGLMKLDCEGAEKDIILSINEDYAQRIENIYYEPTHSLYNPDDLNKHLVNLGYNVTERNGIYRAKKQKVMAEA